MKKAFTITELVVAIGAFALMLSFIGVLFNANIDAHRTAGANAEIMQNLRAITNQLERDFSEICKDGYLLLYSDKLAAFHTDRLYYFCTGDFQSWFDSDVRSNIARVYFGHDTISLSDANIPASRWRLARDVMLLTPGIPEGGDNYNSTFAAFKADESLVVNDANNLLSIDMENDVNDARRLMCENIGEVLIEWTYEDPNNSGMINWFLQDPNSPINWTPTSTAAWPTALKFTFTLYDSEGIIKKGRRFTHIAYLDD
ncbi:MAG: PulJ/GspJ family protein [Planctomycetota bacterium]|jgi:type II secretory pathway pseudopilin PulG